MIKLKIITPGKAEQRGSQLSVIISEDGEKIYQFLKYYGW